jgi:hypothetical protein
MPHSVLVIFNIGNVSNFGSYIRCTFHNRKRFRYRKHIHVSSEKLEMLPILEMTRTAVEHSYSWNIVQFLWKMGNHMQLWHLFRNPTSVKDSHYPLSFTHSSIHKIRKPQGRTWNRFLPQAKLGKIMATFTRTTSNESLVTTIRLPWQQSQTIHSKRKKQMRLIFVAEIGDNFRRSNHVGAWWVLKIWRKLQRTSSSVHVRVCLWISASKSSWVIFIQMTLTFHHHFRVHQSASFTTTYR